MLLNINLFRKQSQRILKGWKFQPFFISTTFYLLSKIRR
nr:MAG TPA: hypothetical protein [Caudoviricetes sp.]